jgi:phosphoglycerate dehydrogenase-like enzyme
MQLKIAVLDDYQGVALRMADWSSLTGKAEVRVFPDNLADEGELVDRLEPFDVICAMRERTPFPKSLLERLPNLKLLVTTGKKNASIDVRSAHERGITVCGTGSSGQGAAELTWALLMAAARHLPTELSSVQTGGWQTRIGTDLSGSTLGVVGLGRLGSAVAGYGKAFGMDVIAWSPNLTEEKASAAGVRLVSREQLFIEADWVTIHLVLSERSRGLLGKDDLLRMKPTAWLINTSRGPVVREGDLLDALQNETIAGAALDVYDVEPLPENHLFRSLPNVLAAPHIGYATEGAYQVFFRDTVECIEAWMDGKPIRTLEE